MTVNDGGTGACVDTDVAGTARIQTALIGSSYGTDPSSPPAADAELPLDVLGSRICAAASRMASATCRWLEMVGEFDVREGWAGAGIRSCAHWLAWTCSESPGVAREHVRVARAMRSLPLARAEFAAGRLSYSKMREITRVLDLVDEVALVDLARTATASQLARAIRGMRRSDRDALTPHARRRVDWYTDDGGMLRLRATLPAEEGALILAAIQAAHQQLQADQRADGTQDPSPAPLASHADALVHVARTYLSGAPPDTSGEDRTTVILHVDSSLLTGPLAPTETLAHSPSAPATAPATVDATASEGRDSGNAGAVEEASEQPGAVEQTASGERSPSESDSLGATTVLEPSLTDRTAVPARDCCQVAGVGGISREAAARLACDAVVIAMVRGAGGAVLGHGRRRRLVSPAQRRAIMVRDGCCQFPGCHRTGHLEIHHVRHWAAGGPTDLDNLVALCRFHHVVCHEGGVAIRPARAMLAGIPRWSFYAPDGAEINAELVRRRFRHDDDFLAWCALLQVHSDDGQAGWRDRRAEAIRPRWAGEPFQLPEVVAALLGNPKVPDSWPRAA